MKTLLLNLPRNLDNKYDYDQVAQPLGLACISSYMKANNLDVTLFDAHAHHLSRKPLLKYVVSEKPDILGLSVMTFHLPTIISFLKDLKSILPEICVVLGGPHVNAIPEETLNSVAEADIAVIGEGECTMVDLVTTLKNDQDLTGVKGIVFRTDTNITRTPQREYIENLSELPYLDWESLPIEKYWDVFTSKKNYARIFASRGCPFNCTFCGASKILGKKIRKRSPKHIVGELKYLYDKFKVREVLFNDSTFNIDNDWVQEICEGIIRMKRPLIWRCNVRADMVKSETIKLMKKSGCVKVIMGVESADEEMLKSMRKGESLEQIKKGIDILKECEMPSDHGFIIGMPGDTVQAISRSIEFAKSIRASVVTFSLATPLPGTTFYEKAKQEGMVVSDWTKFDFFGVPYTPKGMTKEQLQSLYRKAVKEFYLRPAYLWGRLKEMRSFINLKINLWYAFRILLRFLGSFKS